MVRFWVDTSGQEKSHLSLESGTEVKTDITKDKLTALAEKNEKRK